MVKIGVHLRKFAKIKLGYRFFGPPCMSPITTEYNSKQAKL